MSAPDSQITRLRAALERLAQVDETWLPDREGKAALEIQAGSAMDALFAEIGGTVLPARLILSGAEGHVALAVSGRRVQGLLDASDAVLGAHGQVLETILDAEDPDTAKIVGAVVQTLLRGGGPFAIRSEIASRLGAEADPGLTPDQLSVLWATPSAPEQDSRTPLEAFLKSSESSIRGGILFADGSIQLTVGDDTLAQPLVDVLNAAWPDFQEERIKIARDHSDPSLTCWQQSGGPVVAVAAWPDQGLAALAFLPDEMPNIFAIWSNGLETSS